MKLVKAGAVACVAILAMAGCDGAAKEDAPEPTPSNIVNGTNTQVIRMPEGFRNVAVTCYGTNGVYVTSRGAFQTGSAEARALPSSIFVVANDPHCTKQRI